MKKKPELHLFKLFAILGASICIIGAVVFGIYESKSKDRIYTDAVITEIVYRHNDDTPDVYVSYTIDEINYDNVKLNFYTSSYYKGKTIRIYYFDNNKTKIGVSSTDYFFLFFPGFGLTFLTIGGTGLIVYNKRKKKNNKLLESGQRVSAKYLRTEINRNVRINNKSPYRIYCAKPNVEGKETEFISDNIWFDPSPIIESKGIEYFSVFVDETNPNSYYVDVSNIEKN